MKKYITGLALVCGLLAVTAGAAADKKETKPYPLQTCVVSDEKLGSMGNRSCSRTTLRRSSCAARAA